MPANTAPTTVLLVQVVKECETYRVMGQVHQRQLDGEMHSANWNYGHGPAAQYDGFAVHAYLGNTWSSGSTIESEQGVWGEGYSYSPHRIDTAEQAKAIARVMQRLQQGLAQLNDTDGYLTGDDFAGYLLRVTKILKIKEIWTRATPRHRDITGDQFRRMSGASLQHWIKEVDEASRAGNCAELIRR